MVGLDGSADKEAREWNHGETEAAGKRWPGKGLFPHVRGLSLIFFWSGRGSLFHFAKGNSHGLYVKTYMSVVIFAENIQRAGVKVRFDIVKLGDVGVLDRVHQHLTPYHNQKW